MVHCSGNEQMNSIGILVVAALSTILPLGDQLTITRTQNPPGAVTSMVKFAVGGVT